MTIQTPIRPHKRLPIFSQDDWDNVHDALVLALDAMGDGPSTTDKAFVAHNLRYVNTQLKRSYRRAQKWAERVSLKGK